MRSPVLSRLYLQCTPYDDIANWPDPRIWEELHRRLGDESANLKEGKVTQKAITPMRSFVAAPMRHGSRAAMTALAENYVGLPFEEL